MSNVTVINPRQMAAGGNVSAFIPQSLQEIALVAKTIHASGLAPRGMETPEKITIAIMHGAELGLKPMMAVQKIAVVNGKPTIWGDAVPGLVRGSGVCLYIKEWIDGDGDATTAYCETLRKGEKSPVVKKFSVLEAKRAKLWGKSGPWQDYPLRMLAMRARAYALRDTYADVLGGLYLKEEAEDIPDDITPTEKPDLTLAEQVQIVKSGLSDEQVDNLTTRLTNVAADIEAFCTYFKIEKISDLSASDYVRALKLIEQKEARQKASEPMEAANA